MAHSLLFRLSSFIVDRKIYQGQSVHNKELKVMMRNARYLLDSGEANYSFGNLHVAFQQAFLRTKLKQQQLNAALILGFGAGSVAQILRNELNFNCSITGIEIDEAVISLANTYFGLNKLEHCNVIATDANQYLENTTATYDLIVVDLFQQIDVPEKFQTEHFLLQLKRHMNKGAWLYFNFVIDSKLQRENFELLQNKFKQIFPNGSCLQILGSNRILFTN